MRPDLVNHVLIFFQQACRSVSEQCHVLDINTAFRLVQHDERGVLHHELEDFTAFDLAAGESGIDITIEELCHMHAFRQRRDTLLVAVRNLPSFRPEIVGGR